MGYMFGAERDDGGKITIGAPKTYVDPLKPVKILPEMGLGYHYDGWTHTDQAWLFIGNLAIVRLRPVPDKDINKISQNLSELDGLLGGHLPPRECPTWAEKMPLDPHLRVTMRLDNINLAPLKPELTKLLPTISDWRGYGLTIEASVLQWAAIHEKTKAYNFLVSKLSDKPKSQAVLCGPHFERARRYLRLEMQGRSTPISQRFGREPVRRR
jgi:hypothetical protein